MGEALTHAAKLGKVLLGGLVLLVLVDPLVKVGLEEMHLLGLLEQAGPVGVVEVLLAQLDLDVAGCVVDLALGGVDLGVELELEVIRALERLRGAREGQAGGLEIELEARRGHVGHVDGEVDEVLLGVGLGRALRPEDYRGVLAPRAGDGKVRGPADDGKKLRSPSGVTVVAIMSGMCWEKLVLMAFGAGEG